MLYILLTALILVFSLWLIPLLLFRPSNDRNWSKDQAVLPFAEINGNRVHIKNIRNFTYRTTTDYTPGYYDRTFDLDKIKQVYYVVEPFSRFAGAAHTFLSFEFEDDQYVSISAEIRKEAGEEFSPLKGLFRQFEMMYVIADERDVIKLRTNYRHDPVYLYPGKRVSKERLQKLFLSMIREANRLYTTPEFYNTITNTCATTIVRHINEIAGDRIGLSYTILLPGYSDKLAYKLGLLDTELPLDEIRNHFQVNSRAIKYADSPDFSKWIRRYDLKE